MDSLLTKQNIYVADSHDRVILSVGKLDIKMPYAAAFKISQALRVASKHAMRISGENNRNWQQFATLDQYPTVPILNTEQRKTLGGKFDWKVRVDRERVYLDAGNNEIELHFTIALKVSEWIRACGKNAKKWAGDGGRMLHGAGWLSDANENTKQGTSL